MIEHILICVAAIWGIHCSTWEGMLWSNAIAWIESKTPEWVYEWLFKPLYSCPICMSTVWSPIYYFYFMYSPAQTVIPFAVFWLSVAGISAIIVSLRTEHV